MFKEQGFAQLVSTRPSLPEVPGSIPRVNSNPSFYFLPFRVALCSLK